MSYLKIGKKLHLSPSSCFTALERYKQNGNRFINKRLTNWSKAWARNRKIKGADKEFLLSRATLQRWAGYSLVKRCQMIFEERGLKVNKNTLCKFYKDNRVGFVVVKYQY